MNFLWSTSFQPCDKSELVIHSSKIKEVDQILENYSSHYKNLLLFLEGRTGSGKYSTVKVISCRNRTSFSFWPNEDFQEISFSSFRDFLKNTVKFSSISCQSSQIERKYQIVYIREIPEDFQNIHLEFQSFLLKILGDKNIGLCLILCGTHIQKEDFMHYLSFKNEMSSSNKSIDVKSIEFNPIAKSFATKCLKSILTKLKSQMKITNAIEIEKYIRQISLNCQGDLRSAINDFQFRVLSDSISMKCDDLTNNSPQQLDIFHSLGKILHAKREKQDLTETSLLPNHLENMKRSKLTFDIENTLDSLSISAEAVASWLFENYIHVQHDLSRNMLNKNQVNSCNFSGLCFVSNNLSWADAYTSGSHSLNWKFFSDAVNQGDVGYRSNLGSNYLSIISARAVIFGAQYNQKHDSAKHSFSFCSLKPPNKNSSPFKIFEVCQFYQNEVLSLISQQSDSDDFSLENSSQCELIFWKTLIIDMVSLIANFLRTQKLKHFPSWLGTITQIIGSMDGEYKPGYEFTNNFKNVLKNGELENADELIVTKSLLVNEDDLIESSEFVIDET